MTRQLGTISLIVAAAVACLNPQFSMAQHAVQVTSYDAGATPAIDFGSGLPYDDTSTALGEPSRFTFDDFFPGVVSPFSGPYKRDQLLSIGETGHVTLRLSNYALPQVGGHEIGVFAHASLIDVAYPAGQAGDRAAAFSVDSAVVELSANGASWVSLGNITFDIPTNGYSDVTDPFAALPGAIPSDFQKPFVGSLSSFDGLTHAPDILSLLDGSGGGTWHDIPAGLAQVGFIRFSVADDGNPGVDMNFELDAVSVSRDAMGVPTVPEPLTAGLVACAVLIVTTMFARSIAR